MPTPVEYMFRARSQRKQIVLISALWEWLKGANRRDPADAEAAREMINHLSNLLERRRGRTAATLAAIDLADQVRRGGAPAL